MQALLGIALVTVLIWALYAGERRERGRLASERIRALRLATPETPSVRIRGPEEPPPPLDWQRECPELRATPEPLSSLPGGHPTRPTTSATRPGGEP